MRLLLWILMTLSFSLAQAEGEPDKGGAAAYHELAPSIIVNIQGLGRYMRSDVQLMTRDKASLPEIKRHTPALRHQLILLFGDQQAVQIKTSRGKEVLRKKALKALRLQLEALTGEALIDDLFFTTYYVE